MFLYKLARKRFHFKFGDIKLCSNDGEHLEGQRTRINCLIPKEIWGCETQITQRYSTDNNRGNSLFCMFLPSYYRNFEWLSFPSNRKNISKPFFSGEIIPEANTLLNPHFCSHVCKNRCPLRKQKHMSQVFQVIFIRISLIILPLMAP